MSQDLRSTIRQALYRANEEMLRANIENDNPLLRNKQIPEVERALDFRYEMIVDTVIDAIEKDGYYKPPAGDLRMQLLQLGRTLKTEAWGEDYSADRLCTRSGYVSICRAKIAIIGHARVNGSTRSGSINASQSPRPRSSAALPAMWIPYPFSRQPSRFQDTLVRPPKFSRGAAPSSGSPRHVGNRR